MDKPICRVRNLRKAALSGYVSEIDAVATGGCYLAPDAAGVFDASLAHDLCVTCVNCGSVVSNPGFDAQLSCSDCGMDEFHVVQTSAPPPRRPAPRFRRRSPRCPARSRRANRRSARPPRPAPGTRSNADTARGTASGCARGVRCRSPDA